MARSEPDRVWSEAEQEALRQRIAELIRTEDLTQKQVSAESGIPYGTLTPFLGGTYAGDGSRVCEKLSRWLAARDRRAGAALPPPSAQFVATPTARAIHDVLAHAQDLPDMVTITGAPGTGKSSAICAYVRANPNVHKLVAEPALNTVRSLLQALASLLGVYDLGSQHRISRTIARRLTGARALLIVDEAQHLTSSMLDQLRTFHDQCPVGIALVGNEAVIGRLEGGRRSAEFAQLYSRVGMRLRVGRSARAVLADAEALLEAWGVPEEVRPRLRAIARQPGALRAARKTWTIAQLVARVEERGVTDADITLAWERLAAQPVAEAAP